MVIYVQTHSINFIKGLPLFILGAQSLCRLNGPLHVTGPHLQVTDVLALDEAGQSLCILKVVQHNDWLRNIMIKYE